MISFLRTSTVLGNHRPPATLGDGHGSLALHRADEGPGTQVLVARCENRVRGRGDDGASEATDPKSWSCEG